MVLAHQTVQNSMLSNVHNEKISDGIVMFISVNMVYVFTLIKLSSDMLLNNVTVFSESCAIYRDSIIFSCNRRFLVSSVANLRTKFLVLLARGRVKFFATLDTFNSEICKIMSMIKIAVFKITTTGTKSPISMVFMGVKNKAFFTVRAYHG